MQLPSLELRKSVFPYPNFSDIKVKTGEPMSSAYFNVHIIRLYSDIKALSHTYTIQKASWEQWGIVKFASVDDVINDDGNKNTVITNDCLNRVISKIGENNRKQYNLNGRLSFSSKHEFVRGEFIVGLNENIAKKVTSYPERVEFANVYFIPIGFEKSTFRTANSKMVDKEAFESGVSNAGVINFAEWKRPDGYNDFHCYYNESGYIICKNGKYNDAQKQIKVVYELFVHK